MVSGRTSIFCERCGAAASVTDRDAQARYCANCKLFICTDCWDAEAFRCTTCASKASRPKPGPHANLYWASKAFRDLATVRPERESLNAVGPQPSSAVDLEHRLLTIKADDATSAALSALANAPQDQTTRELRQRVELERLRIAGMASPPTHPPRPRRDLPRLPSVERVASEIRAAWLTLRSLGQRVTTPRWPPMAGAAWRALSFEAAWSRLRSARPFGVRVPHWRVPHRSLPAVSMRCPSYFAAAMAAGGVAALIVGATVIYALLPAAADQELGATSGPSLEGDVAGGRSASSPSPPTLPPTAGRRRVTFDTLSIGMPLPDRWRVRGSAGSVQVVAFPNPFDRSLQIMRSSDSRPSVACYRMGAAATAISVDVFSAAPAGMAVSLRDPKTRALGVAVDDDGSILLQPGNRRLGDAVVEPALWYHVSFVMDMAAGSITLQVEPRDTVGLAGVQVKVPFGGQTGPPVELCVASPSLTGESVIIDNVTVEYRPLGPPD